MGKPRIPQITLSRELADALIALDKGYRGRSKRGWVEHVEKHGKEAALASRTCIESQGSRILAFFGIPASEDAVSELAGVADVAFWQILVEKFRPESKRTPGRLPGLVKGTLVCRIIDQFRIEWRDRIPRLIARAVEDARDELRKDGVVRPSSQELGSASAARLTGKMMKESRKKARDENPAAYFALLSAHSMQGLPSAGPEAGSSEEGDELDIVDRRAPSPDLRARAMEFFRLLFNVLDDLRFREFLYYYLACDQSMEDAGDRAFGVSKSRTCQYFARFKRSLFTRLDLSERRDQAALVKQILEGAPRLWEWLTREKQRELMTEFGISRAV